MAPYSSKLLDLARDFRHGGAMEAPTSVGKSSCDGRPPFTTFYLRLSEGRVSDASFQTFGCGVAIAACEALAALAIGRKWEECAAIDAREVIEFLEGVPEDKQFCVDLALAACQAALRQCQECAQTTHS